MDNINKGATTNVYIKYCKICKDRRYPAPNGPIGQSVNIQNRYVPHFKPGKNFRESVKDAGTKITP